MLRRKVTLSLFTHSKMHYSVNKTLLLIDFLWLNAFLDSNLVSIFFFALCTPLILPAPCVCLFGWLVSVVLVICQASKATGHGGGHRDRNMETWR